MASAKVNFSVVLFFLFHFLVLDLPLSACDASPLKGHKHRCVFDAIYQLGDSISDTGNLVQENPASLFARFPYGETFFKKATGRCSNGLLIVDYIALSAGVPFLEAYLNPNAIFSSGHGVNFAVAGSTALPVNVLADSKILAPVTNSSLSTQLDWMFSYFNGICYNDKDCAYKLKSSLFIVGEIGGNDYNYALFQGKTLEEVKAMVPNVVQSIKDAIKRVIGYGARRLLVPGNFPIGCLPMYLTGFKTNDSTAYDEFQCLKELNNLSIHHNEHLQQIIEDLRKEHSHVTIGYGDYYSAYQWILGHASLLGFDVKSLQKACCGIGGEYNFNFWKMCGAVDIPVCVEPHRHISWDGIHLTQEAYKHIARYSIRDMHTKGQSQELKICGFDAIYQFGDSVSDTGNSIIEHPRAYHSRLPYGETIGKATGRPSDGLLIVDYIAQSAHLPLVEPFENPNSNFSHGVDFAVAGVAVLPVETLEKLQIPPRITNSSLNVQLEWFDKYLKTICNDTKDCQEKLKSSLFMMGTIGANDYDAGFFQNKSIEEVKNVMVPMVVQAISDAIKKVIDYGAVQVIVPGIFKLGCTAALLTAFSSNNASAYDTIGCLKDYNEFFAYHNDRLQLALEELRKENPNVHIIYGDLFNAHQWIIDNQSNLGFKVLKETCCGIGGKYNFTPGLKNMCGASGVSVCANPKEYIFWDEWHFTHEANKHLTEWLIKDILPKLQCSN